MALEAENNYYNARVDLNNSMYLDSQPDYKIKILLRLILIMITLIL